MTANRRTQLIAARNRLNKLGDDCHNAAGSPWDARRIRCRNRINARLAR